MNSISEKTNTERRLPLVFWLISHICFQEHKQATVLSMNQSRLMVCCPVAVTKAAGRWMKCDSFLYKRDSGIQQDGDLTMLSHWRQIKAVLLIINTYRHPTWKQGWHRWVIALPFTSFSCMHCKEYAIGECHFLIWAGSKIDHFKVTRTHLIKILVCLNAIGHLL